MSGHSMLAKDRPQDRWPSEDFPCVDDTCKEVSRNLRSKLEMHEDMSGERTFEDDHCVDDNCQETRFTTVTLVDLTPETRYQIRITGMANDGQVGEPALSEWLSTLPANVVPDTVEDIYVQHIKVKDKRVTVNITWVPALDQACFYEVAAFPDNIPDYNIEEVERKIPVAEEEKHIKTLTVPGDLDSSDGRSKERGVTPSPLVKDEWEICLSQLIMGDVLGEGAFGVVCKGLLQDKSREDRWQEVAVKMLKDHPLEEDVQSFQEEIKMMKSVGRHPNIVSIIGCCTQVGKMRLIVEYCALGDLKKYLRNVSKRGDYINSTTAFLVLYGWLVKGGQSLNSRQA
uniref:Protein kinase domain-containing protein n=1 Tax=Timema genevievae TaxID=629358 RepID=A0A7R9JY04_TIMGE|nr:unnamed protein product [Timema genevievae]